MGLRLVTGPAAQPVTLAEAKAHLRVTHAQDDAYIASIVAAATRQTENDTSRRWITQRWACVLDAFPSDGGAVVLPLQPVAPTGAAVKYLDSAGTEQTWNAANWALDVSGPFARVAPVASASWPAAANRIGAVSIEFDAGCGDASAVPADVKAAILLVAGTLYEQRATVVTGTIVSEVPAAARLLWPYRLLTVT
jgi:uncharacterized phiE125 gp8 family phage protein